MSGHNNISDGDTFRIQPIDGDEGRNGPRQNAATGASAAGVRAISAQIVAFYFRAPVKAFFRTRVDYMAYAKAISPQNEWWSWRNTTPGLLATAIQSQGWKFLPQHVLPPLFANVTVGALLYTSYLQILGVLHTPSSTSTKRVFPPPSPTSAFLAGTLAGGIQSFVAAPLDALQVRFDRSDAIEGKYKDMWTYARHKLYEIGPRGVFAGWTISFFKDTLGCGIFFMTFEYIKAQAYYHFLSYYYGRSTKTSNPYLLNPHDTHEPIQIRPHYAIEPLFLLLAGITASITQSTVQYPLSTFQTLHYERLETIDHATKNAISRRDVLRTYYQAYQFTLSEARASAAKDRMSLTRYLYKSFWWNTIRTVPSTSAGLVIFELVRRKYGVDTGEEIRVSRKGREDIIVY